MGSLYLQVAFRSDVTSRATHVSAVGRSGARHQVTRREKSVSPRGGGAGLPSLPLWPRRTWTH